MIEMMPAVRAHMSMLQWAAAVLDRESLQMLFDRQVCEPRE